MTIGNAVKRTTRYTLVGAVCAIAYNTIMILGSRFGGGYIGLSVLAFLLVTPLGYLLHARFTFGVGRSWLDFARFASGIAANFPVCIAVMATLCSGLHLVIPIAAPIATVIMYILNYVMSHWALRIQLPFWPVTPAREHLPGLRRTEGTQETA